MPHVYDSGEALPQRTAIRAAVIQRLQLLSKPALYARTIAALPIPLGSGDAGPELDRVLQGNNPAILVALGRGEASAAGMGPNRALIEIALTVYVVSSNTRDLVTGRLAGDVRSSDVTQDPGIETMVEHVEELLTGWDPGIPGVAPLRLQAEGDIDTKATLTIWEIEFSIRVDRFAGRHPALAAMLESIAAAHNAHGADVANPVIETVTDVEAP